MSSSSSSSTLHQNEWIYSTFVSRSLKLHDANYSIHHLSRLPHLFEFPIFLCGYAFNPVVVPLWMGLVYRQSSLSSQYAYSTLSSSSSSWKQPLRQTIVYVATLLLVLVCTEISKASFATTRPEQLQIMLPNQLHKKDDNTSKGQKPPPSTLPEVPHRYQNLVSSLKSKHSFPSGDCAQAANVCFFFYYYLPASSVWRDAFLFGIFLPGVCFARVFYKCHWLEDCLGGIALSSVLHWCIVSRVETAVSAQIRQWM